MIPVRRPAWVLLTACLVFAAVGCKSERSPVTVQNEEPPASSQLSSTIQMNDAAAAPQLLSGFYAIENNAWRWTSGKFSVSLRTPPAAQSGAVVALSFAIPDVVVQKLGKITLTASAAGAPLKSQEYATAGAYVFNADIPPGPLLNAENFTVEFSVDKILRLDTDRRDLGIIAKSVSISAK